MNTINLTTLPPQIKRPVWHSIQNDAPALASLLQEEELRDLVAHFDATIHITVDQLPPSAIDVLKQHARKA